MGGQGRRYDDGVRDAARELRRSGRTYADIALELGISRSTCSLWLRDVPDDAPAGQLALDLDGRARHGGDREHVRRVSRARWDAVLAEREQERQQVRAAAAASVGEVSGRDLVLALAVSYWCEGTKSKPWRPQERVVWLNSDPGLVRLFLAGLRELGVPDETRVFRLQIHEHADEQAARGWWAAVVGVDAGDFAPSTLKRHNPRPVRRNVGQGYHGCLSISVRRGKELYQYLDGVVRGLVQGAEEGDRVRRVAR